MSGYVRLSKILAKSNGNIFFECPACETPHGINCGDGHGQVWSWDGDVNKPTFSPSLLVTYTQYLTPEKNGKKKEHVCHSFVRGGRIEYLSDCTHELAGKTVDIPEWEIECEGCAAGIGIKHSGEFKGIKHHSKDDALWEAYCSQINLNTVSPALFAPPKFLK